ncbi:hypothetical protein OEZ85_001835 [Tetradesmus obliquus]|uniref:EGF-like domain-containing protein n=1 Tax=Tetradesmus obliquus TaxID=3088 RepID=A0ABY8U115_TETOB|nr:hypothetical protein OEZ85_001835 [Tetradesmus obliquus]
MSRLQTVPIRIWVEYQGIDSLSADGKQHLQNVVKISLGVLQKFYKVRRPAPGRLQVRPFCRMWDSANYCNQHQPDFLGSGSDNTCGSALINSSHIAQYTQCTLGGGSCQTFKGGGGEFTDYYLYITAIQDEHCSSGAVAWALPCLYDDATNRPLLGSANICPEALANGNTNSGVAVLVHELTHALGFTDDMFDKFIDAEGQPIPQTKVVQAYTDAYGRSTSMIITPTVVKETQAQFGCDRVPGAALENEGGQGSAMAHWEYRWFQGELMVATNLFAVYGKPATMSRITLAFMQDTGWYDVDWDSAGFLNWGWQAGCDFVGKTCADFAAANPSQQYFCTRDQYADTVNTVCTFDGLARAKCEDAQFADGCTMKVALGTAPNCLSRQYASSAGDKFGWQNSPSSRCIPVTWLFNTFTYQFPDSQYKDGWKDSMCYKSSCNAQNQLQLSILGNNVTCPSGQTVDLAKALPGQFQKGSVGPCPDNAAMCDSLSCGESCTVGGTCVSGRCYCNLEYTGPGCAKRLTPDGNYTNYEPVVDDGQPAGSTFDNGYLMVSVRLENSQEVLYRSLDKYKAAVAQLAGVTTSRVAVLSFLSDAPATSLIGKRRRLAAAGSSSSEGSDAQQQLQRVEVGWTPVEQQQQGDGSSAASAHAGSSSGSFLRQLLLEALRSGQLEVYSRIATQNAADATAITGRINNATRQAKFEKDLSDAGLKLIQGSITVRSMDASGAGSPGGWGLPGVNFSDPNTRRILIIVAASVGAGLFVLLLGWALSCCYRKRRRWPQQHAAAPGHAHPSQQQFLTSGYGYYNSPGNTPSSSGHSSVGGGRAQQQPQQQQQQQQQQPPSSWVRPLFGGSGAGAAAAQQGSNGRPLVNPFACTAVQFGRGGAGAAGSAVGSSPYPQQPGGQGHYYSPSPPAAGSGYTVQGHTFRTLREAEEFQLALALQRSLQQQGPPAHFLPHGGYSAGPVSERLQQQQQPQGPTGYPAVGYAPG